MSKHLWGAAGLTCHRDHLPLLRELLAGSGVGGAAAHDARIAAICLSHGVDALWSADRDFGRFPRLRVHNPLVGA